MKVLFLFGTRPEAIKLIPIILAMKNDDFFKIQICVTGQHREMLDQVLKIFNISPDIDLDVMVPNQSLAFLTARIIEGVDKIVKEIQPDYCIIQGDTTSVMAGALACFYNQVKVAHVEAGLRTFRKDSPFPEEINRVLAAQLSNIHFPPTTSAKVNLLKENIPEQNIYVTGNTVIDALHLINRKIEEEVAFPENEEVRKILYERKKILLVTSHRRENFGQGIISICNALKRFSETYPSMNVVFPVHLNPNIQGPVYDILKECKNVFLLRPLDYVSFVALMNKCFFILTDSGGIQEEAPAFGKPVLVMRDSTERPEALSEGLSKLVGTNEENIFKNLALLMEDHNAYCAMSNGINPYGDGKAAQRIVSFLKKSVCEK
jgi:UDP-N-acetylglucosamine 2-epimerase (non-hydrolysing)